MFYFLTLISPYKYVTINNIIISQFKFYLISINYSSSCLQGSLNAKLIGYEPKLFLLFLLLFSLGLKQLDTDFIQEVVEFFLAICKFNTYRRNIRKYYKTFKCRVGIEAWAVRDFIVLTDTVVRRRRRRRSQWNFNDSHERTWRLFCRSRDTARRFLELCIQEDFSTWSESWECWIIFKLT